MSLGTYTLTLQFWSLPYGLHTFWIQYTDYHDNQMTQLAQYMHFRGDVCVFTASQRTIHQHRNNFVLLAGFRHRLEQQQHQHLQVTVHGMSTDDLASLNVQRVVK